VKTATYLIKALEAEIKRLQDIIAVKNELIKELQRK